MATRECAPARSRCGADAEPRSGRRGEPLQRLRRGPRPAAFQARDRRLGRLHPRGELLLGEARRRTGAHHLAGQRVLRAERLMRFALRVRLHPLPVQGFNFAHVLNSRARHNASRISCRGVRWVFFTKTRTTATRRPDAVTKIALAIPLWPFNRISHRAPARRLTWGSPTRSSPNCAINCEIHTKRARMPAGSASGSRSTTRSSVSIHQAMETLAVHHIRYVSGQQTSQVAGAQGCIGRQLNHLPRAGRGLPRPRQSPKHSSRPSCVAISSRPLETAGEAETGAPAS